MDKWYKQPITKGILVFIAILSAFVLLISTLLVDTFTADEGIDSLFKENRNEYTESKNFFNQMSEATGEVLQRVKLIENFETNGKYNPDKLVDIMEYASTGIISGKNTSGLAYKLEDLRKWSENFYNYSYSAPLVVCQKPDGSYFYYYLNDFTNLVNEGKLQFEVSGYSVSEVLDEMRYGSYFEGNQIKNEKGEVVYTGFWGYTDTLQEEAAPEGAGNLLEAVNQNPDLNGKMTRIYTNLQSILESLFSEVASYRESGSWTEGNTNFVYIYVDKETNKVYTNRQEYQDFSQVNANIKKLQSEENMKYFITYPKLSDFETNMDVSAREWSHIVKENIGDTDKDFIFAAAVDTTLPIQDAFYEGRQTYETYVPYIGSSVFGGIVSAILLLISCVWLTVIAGRNSQDEELHLNGFDKWKTELAAAVVISGWLIVTIIVISAGGFYVSRDFSNVIFVGFYMAFTMGMFLIGYLSLVRRIKAKELWKNSILKAVCRFAEIFWKNRSVTWRTVLILGGFILIHWLALLSQSGVIALIVLVSEAVVIYLAVMNAIAKNRIKKGIREIAAGDLQYQIPLDYLQGENRNLAEMVNDIGNGLQRAVNESMKSERLKTDLITNVSHDIKTPLTSIINYVDLLKRENFDDPKIQGYLEILESKAQRLKTLTEDVVEASKVSSGNVNLEYMDVDLVEMIHQTAGEFAEKFENKKLELIQTLPENPVVIHVDGRRVWRVLENLYGNVAKYAMPGTRVYADLTSNEDKVIFSLKNISEYSLNITADELTERFIRGDISRSTEGSGLGLSIAKSLVEMQGGEFSLYLDGDLFKATVIFERVVK